MQSYTALSIQYYHIITICLTLTVDRNTSSLYDHHLGVAGTTGTGATGTANRGLEDVQVSVCYDYRDRPPGRSPWNRWGGE